VDILGFFGLESVWATFWKIGRNYFFKSSGHPNLFSPLIETFSKN
jgi:hypothetical protein